MRLRRLRRLRTRQRGRRGVAVTAHHPSVLEAPSAADLADFAAWLTEKQPEIIDAMKKGRLKADGKILQVRLDDASDCALMTPLIAP